MRPSTTHEPATAGTQYSPASSQTSADAMHDPAPSGLQLGDDRLDHVAKHGGLALWLVGASTRVNNARNEGLDRIAAVVEEAS